MEHASKTAAHARASAMRLFALSPWELLDGETRHVADTAHDVLRGPEIGLVMLRGRMGSTGNAFNFGEATVTRCTVRLPSGVEGHAYIQGRNADHAKRAALCDALYQQEPARLDPVLQNIDQHLSTLRHQSAAKAAATKVDFFTMVRGDD
jgi:alpha-D-ribose 1-methylphosphonate 5-triphosphate synthase subunit PhnG